MTNHVVNKDFDNCRLIIKRRFAGSVARVWQCWTERELLDRWWGPRQWPCTTKSIDFREGGHWHYCLTGPEGSQHWSWVNYLTISLRQFFISDCGFCDDKGTKNAGIPGNQWHVEFTADANATMVTTTLSFESVKDMEMMIQMGFEAGFTDQLGRLDELLTQ